jgi:hypothetical protein
MKTVNVISAVLLVIGGLNWGPRGDARCGVCGWGFRVRKRRPSRRLLPGRSGCALSGAALGGYPTTVGLRRGRGSRVNQRSE